MYVIQVINKTFRQFVEASWVFPSLQQNSYESRGLIEMYFWPLKGLSLRVEIVVAQWVFQTCSKQSASGIGR